MSPYNEQRDYDWMFGLAFILLFFALTSEAFSQDYKPTIAWETVLVTKGINVPTPAPVPTVKVGDKCPECNGTGWNDADGNPANRTKCIPCRGDGKVDLGDPILGPKAIDTTEQSVVKVPPPSPQEKEDVKIEVTWYHVITDHCYFCDSSQRALDLVKDDLYPTIVNSKDCEQEWLNKYLGPINARSYPSDVFVFKDGSFQVYAGYPGGQSTDSDYGAKLYQDILDKIREFASTPPYETEFEGLTYYWNPVLHKFIEPATKKFINVYANWKPSDNSNLRMIDGTIITVRQVNTESTPSGGPTSTKESKD